MLFDISVYVLSVLIVCISIMMLRYKDHLLRIQALNVLNSLIVVFILVYVNSIGKPEHVDIALLYAILSYTSILGIHKYFTKTKGEY